MISYPEYLALKKLASTETTKAKAIQLGAQARPWIKSGVTAAVPAAVAANFLLPIADSSTKRRLVAAAGMIGGTAGVADRYLKNWAKKQKRSKGSVNSATRRAATQILKQGSAGALTMRKVAAMAADLRRKGIGGVPRPPFPTEDSKEYAVNKLHTSGEAGKFYNTVKARNLRAPGPAIQQVATI